MCLKVTVSKFQLPLFAKQSQSLLEFKSKMKTPKLSALVHYAGLDFVIMNYSRVGFN